MPFLTKENPKSLIVIERELSCFITSTQTVYSLLRNLNSHN
jgi:hypothetical protein